MTTDPFKRAGLVLGPTSTPRTARSQPPAPPTTTPPGTSATHRGAHPTEALRGEAAWPQQALEAITRLQRDPLPTLEAQRLAWLVVETCEADETGQRVALLIQALLEIHHPEPTRCLLSAIHDARLELPALPEGALEARLSQLLAAPERLVALAAAHVLARCLPGGRALLAAALEDASHPHHAALRRLQDAFLATPD